MSAQEGSFYSRCGLIPTPVPHHYGLHICVSLSLPSFHHLSPCLHPRLVFLPTPSFSDFLGIKRSLHFRAKAKPCKPSWEKPSLFWRDDIYERGSRDECVSFISPQTTSSTTAKARHLHISSPIAFQPLPPSPSSLNTRKY